MRLPLMQKLDTDTLDIIDTVKNITSSYTSELDKCINEIQTLLSNEEDIPPQQLNYYISVLPILLYDITGKITELGIKSDAAKMQRRTVFNDAYIEQTQGTVSKKTSIAQNQSMNEQFVEDVMLRAYKECASKIEIATMLHSSLKKVQSWKTSELEITRNNIIR